MKYKPSRNFLLSLGLLMYTFFTLQGVVVPSLVKDDLAAAALRSQSAQPALISGIFRKSAWEEFDEKAKTIRETNVTYYIEKADGKTTTLRAGGKVDESLLNQYVNYDPLTRTITSALNGGGTSRADEKPEKGDGGSDDEHEKIDSVVFLVQFTDSTPVNMTANEYESRLFGPFGWIKKFYGDMTHGDIVMGADVYGWYTYPEVGVYEGNGNCNLINENVLEIADFYGVDLSDYERVITITNCEDYDTLGGAYVLSSPGYLGLGWVRIVGHYDRLLVGGTFSYSGDWPGLVWNMNHELGHTFGLSHSSSLDCLDKTIWSDCSVVDYGNPFDAMGHWSGRIFNFTKQKEAGWIDDDNILYIDQPGNYHLDNLQTDGGIVGAIIEVQDMPLYAVEHRMPEGFDSYLEHESYNRIQNGLILYSSVMGESRPVDWKVVDPHPTIDSIYDDLVHDAIYSYQAFLDSNFGVSVDVTNVSESGVDFTVDYIDYLYQIPSAPSNLTIEELDNGNFLLCWQDDSDSATGFTIHVRVASYSGLAQNYTVSSTTSCQQIFSSNLEPGVLHYFYIRANGEPLNSQWLRLEFIP